MPRASVDRGMQRTERGDGDSGSLAMTAVKVAVIVFFVAAVGLIAVFGYAHLDDGPETPEFEETGELRFEVVNDWEDTGPYDGYDRGEIESLVVEYTNQERVEEGLETVDEDGAHVEVARGHSEDMARHGYVGHVDSDGREFEERVEGGDCSTLGENAGVTLYEAPVEDERTGEIVRNTDEDEVAQSLVDGWMASPLHRENVLDEYDSLSVGVYVSEGNAVFATQVFCAE